MQTYQAALHYTLVRIGDHDPLGKPMTFVEYVTGAFEDCATQESLWLISMTPKWRPIARTLIKAGPLVAAMTSPRELFRVALHADANAIAVVRGEPSANVELTVHDQRAIHRFGETAGWLNVEFVDYFVLSARSAPKPEFTSWRSSLGRR